MGALTPFRSAHTAAFSRADGMLWEEATAAIRRCSRSRTRVSHPMKLAVRGRRDCPRRGTESRAAAGDTLAALLVCRRGGYASLAAAPALESPEGEVANQAFDADDAPGDSCMQKPRRMRHQQGVQRAAHATSRARRPRISRSFLAHSGDVLDQRRALARAQGVALGLSVAGERARSQAR